MIPSFLLWFFGSYRDGASITGKGDVAGQVGPIVFYIHLLKLLDGFLVWVVVLVALATGDGL